MKVSAVIAALNEEATIGEVIRGVRPYVDEVLVIDGHSTDRTREVAEEAGARVVLDRGRGKGDAIRIGFREAAGDIVVLIDADGSHDPRDIPRLIEPILQGTADHVSASRLLGGSSELHGTFAEFLRLTGSSFVTACINHRFGVRLSDSQNGFRAIRTAVARKLRLVENRTTIEQELIVETLRAGYRLVEVPSHEHRRKAGRSKVSVSKLWWRYLLSLVRLLARSTRARR